MDFTEGLIRQAARNSGTGSSLSGREPFVRYHRPGSITNHPAPAVTSDIDKAREIAKIVAFGEKVKPGEASGKPAGR